MTDDSHRVAGVPQAVKATMVGTMMNVVRTSPVGSKVDLSALVKCVTDKWQGVLDVTLLYELVAGSKNVLPSEAAQVFLLLKHREKLLSVTLKLPAAVERLPQPQQELLLQEALRAGAQSGVTHLGLKKVAGPPPMQEASPAQGLSDRVKAILKGGS